MATYDDWKADVGPWPSVGDRPNGGPPRRRSPWFRPPLGEEPTSVTVLDLTGPAEPTPAILDLADPRPTVVDLAGPDVVLDLSEPEPEPEIVLDRHTRKALMQSGRA